MKCVKIDKEIFNTGGSAAAGLVTGLKRLSDAGYELYVNGSIDNTVMNILRLEEITLAEDNASETGMTRITLSDNEIIIAGNEKYSNIGEAAVKLAGEQRTAEVTRTTKETDIRMQINLDGTGKADIDTGIGFFDHMLEQIARHGNVDMNLKVTGDLHVDEHHTVEDTGLVLGECLRKALGDKKGIRRYAFLLPMDDSIAKIGLDLGGRAFLNYKCKFKRALVGEFPVELIEEFFRAVSAELKANIYIRCKGKNDHHKAEAVFKGFAKCLNDAASFDIRSGGIPSTKGTI